MRAWFPLWGREVDGPAHHNLLCMLQGFIYPSYVQNSVAKPNIQRSFKTIQH